MAFAKFMANPLGRGVRVLLGVVLIAVGLFVMEGAGGIVVALIGVLPVLAGTMNFCTVAPVLGVPFWGQKALNSK